jgi:hypothetical protein
MQNDRAYNWLGFSSWKEYGAQLRDTPALLWHRAAHASHEYKLLGAGSSPLRRGLNGMHVTFLGVGECGYAAMECVPLCLLCGAAVPPDVCSCWR